jgi:putative spermidine/putrescine transport system permease protein
MFSPYSPYKPFGGRLMSSSFREKYKIPLMLTPALMVIFFLFLGGLLLGFLQSIGFMPLTNDYGISLKSYISVLKEKAFFLSLGLSLWIGLGATIISSIMAIICALTLRESLWGKRIVSFIYQLNIPVPHIVGAIAILFLFSQSGLFSRFTYLIGLTKSPAEFPELIYDKYGIGILLEFLWKEIAFTGVILIAVLQSLGEDYENLARTLGANIWQRFFYVILPLIMPGLLRASILVFAFSFGSFEIPFILGSKYPTALPVLAYQYYSDVDLNFRGEAMAVCMIIAVISTLLIYVYMQLSKKYIRAD